MADPILGVSDGPGGSSWPGGLGSELSDTQEQNIERLINYIATTPRNTNYQIVREAIKALILNTLYNWDALSMDSNETEEPSSDLSPKPGGESTPDDDTGK